MVALNEDRRCVRAMGRKAKAFIERGCPIPEVKLRADGSKADHKNEPWRRETGITVEQEPFMDRKERRAGIAAFFSKIAAEYLSEPVAERKLEFAFEPSGLWGGRGGLGAQGGSGVLPLTPRDGTACRVGPLPQGERGLGDSGVLGDSGGYPLIPRDGTACRVGLLPSGEKDLPLGERDIDWASENQSRRVLNWVELDFNISAHQLNLLAKEFRGVTAMELIDGLRVKPVQAALAELLKVYARELWLSPGLYANVLVSDQRLKIWSQESSFFCDPAEEWRKAELYETRAERREALIAAFDAGWKRGHQARDSFAARLGFRSFTDLNRACLNVYGKTVRQLAYDLVCEIVELYLAAEMKALRDLAEIDSTSHAVMRARFLYKGNCAPLKSERWDFWDSCGDAAWRDALYEWLMRCD